MRYYVWNGITKPELIRYSAVHGVYATREAAETMVRRILERYKATTRVECVIVTEWPQGARALPLPDIKDDEGNLLPEYAGQAQ